MELEKQNIYRLLNMIMWRLRKNWRQYFMLLFARLYIIIGYVALVLFAKNSIADCSKPIGLMLVLIIVAIFYLVYVLFNHIVIRKIINNYSLYLIDLLLLLTLIIVIR